jgi:ADP-ribose pyrophosphatase YjhB (NUDIX family)
MISDTYKFCPMCGHALETRVVELEHKERPVCPSCGFIRYDNPTPAAGVIVRVDDRVLLVKRKYKPKVGMWTLPAGFVETGEDAAACAIREAKEETNLDVEMIRLFGVYSAFDDPRAAVVLIFYLCKQVGGTLRCGDDASDARFFEFSNLPEDIAFRAHRRALADILKAFADGNL